MRDGRCNNCGTRLAGAYCHACGQRELDDEWRSIGAIVRQLWDETVSVDFKSVRSSTGGQLDHDADGSFPAMATGALNELVEPGPYVLRLPIHAVLAGYLFVALRRVYGEPAPRTAVKPAWSSCWRS